MYEKLRGMKAQIMLVTVAWHSVMLKGSRENPGSTTQGSFTVLFGNFLSTFFAA